MTAQQNLVTGGSSRGTNENEEIKNDNEPQALTTDEATPVAPQNNTNGAVQPLHQLTPGQETQGYDKNTQRSIRPVSSHQRKNPPGRPPPLPPYPQAYTNAIARAGRVGSGGPGMIVESPTGGVQVTLDGGSSWSDLARQDATLPTDASGANNELGGKPESSGGVFGFLNRKKGRGHSPKPKERGVLGKEGARVVIG
jgi:serine/threonine kinase 32